MYVFREKHVRVYRKKTYCVFLEGKINKRQCSKRMIALRKHCLFYGINRDVLFNERSGLQIGGALLYTLELSTAFLVAFQFHVVAEDTDLVRFF